MVSDGSLCRRCRRPFGYSTLRPHWQFTITTSYGSKSRSRTNRSSRIVPPTRAQLTARSRTKKEHPGVRVRSEEHTSELQSLMRISYAVFFLTKKPTIKLNYITTTDNTI